MDFNSKNIEMKSIIANQFDFLEKTLMNSTNLERFCRYCHYLRPYSIRNVLLLMYQSNGIVRKCHGADEWKRKYNAIVLNNAKPLYIYAPIDNKPKEFCITCTYDIRDTNLKGLPKRKSIVDLKWHLNLINALANKFGLSIAKNNTFSYNSRRNVKIYNNTIYVNANLTEKLQNVLCLKEICVHYIERDIQSNKYNDIQTNSSTQLKEAIAMVSAFEISDWLLENPPKINTVSKKIIVTEGYFKNNLKYANRIAFKMIKTIEDIVSSTMNKK